MSVRRIVVQVGVIAGGVTFGLTLYRSMMTPSADILHACIRAIGAGILILICTLIIANIADKLTGSPDEQSHI